MNRTKLVRLAQKLEKRLREDILERYHNAEYWDPGILDEYLHGLSEEDQAELLELVDDFSN